MNYTESSWDIKYEWETDKNTGWDEYNKEFLSSINDDKVSTYKTSQVEFKTIRLW